MLLLGLVLAVAAAGGNAGAALLEALAARRSTHAATVVLQPVYIAGLLLDILSWVLTVAALPYTTVLMRAAHAAHDLGFEEEARTLGATARQAVLRVQLPLLAPALAGAAFLAFLVGWSDYVVTLLVGGGQLVTLPLLVASAAAATGNEAQVAVLSLSSVLPPLVLLVAVGIVGRRR